MSSLADAPDLVGFFSYSREDDEGSGGKLSKLRERIQEELRGQLGRTKKDFRLWQDKVAIAHGELWEGTIKKGVSESVFFIPIITPTAVRSSYCKFEFESFLAREKELDRNNLIFPILYIPVPALTDNRWRQNPLLAIIGSRQYEDWQNLRHLDASSTEVAQRVEKFCANICRALVQEWLSPEERRETEARRAAEAERRRQQELENKQRADEEERQRKAEAEKRRRDVEERRLQQGVTRFDNTTLRLAEAEAREEQRRKRLEQEPQQPVKPWLLPLIGGVSAVFPTLLILIWFSILSGEVQRAELLFFFGFIPLITFLYGGVAGMLIRHIGILKAVAISVIPYVLLVFSGLATFPATSKPGDAGGITTFFVLPSVMCTCLAFWLYSRWARKQRSKKPG